MKQLQLMLEHLKEPEYVHVLLNPVPVYGLALGVIALIIALFFRNRHVLVPALAAICLSAAVAWPVYHYGEEGYDRVYSVSNTEGDAWLNTHMHRAEKLIYAFYALAVIAAVAIVAAFRWPKSALPLAVATLIFGSATLGMGFWIVYAGGKVRHSEFRSATEPPLEGPQKEEDHD